MIITVMLAMEDPVMDVRDHVLVVVEDAVVVLDVRDHALVSADQDAIPDAPQDVVALVLRVVPLVALLALLHVTDAVEFVPVALPLAKVVRDALMDATPVVRIYAVEHVQQNVEMDVKLVAILDALRVARISVFLHVQEPA